ncbi:MAG: transcription elongation factor GreA [Bacteroidetes bacterium QH_2_67_10]|nr:MAG: transcription elongation factor GreA [Bacteroidetes bacterium QH_2_67_10]
MAEEQQQTVYLTEEGLQELEEELHHLKHTERPRVSEEIAEARAKGDLSENAEYDAAKEEQGKLEARINKLEDTLARARVVDESEVDRSKAYILSNVRVKNLSSDTEHTYTLVSEQEADLSEGKISVNSPVGEGLLGSAEGDEVEVDVPAGTVTFKVLEIGFAVAAQWLPIENRKPAIANRSVGARGASCAMGRWPSSPRW